MSVLGEVKGKVLRSLPLGGSQDEPKLSREQVLGARPVRNPDVEWQLDNGHVLLEIPRDDHWYVKMMGFLFNIPKTHKVRLDHIGSEVWQSFDGETTVEEIAERMSREHQLGYKEMELSLLEFLKDLAKRQYVGVLVGPGGVDEAMAQAGAGDENGAPDAERGAEPPATSDTAEEPAGDSDTGAITRAILSRTNVMDVKEEK